MENIQKKVKDFCITNYIDSSIEYRVLDLVSEIGEFAKEIIKHTDYGKNATLSNVDDEAGEKIIKELGDVFYSIITIANALNINLEQALDIIISKKKSKE